MKGQTTIAPCAWCGLPASTEVEVRGPRVVTDVFGERQKVPAATVPACDDHKHPSLAPPLEKALQVCALCGKVRCTC